MSIVRFKEKELKFLGRLSVNTLESLGLLAVSRNVGENKEYMECNNFTLVNLVLKFFGPMHERSTTVIILLIQVSNGVNLNPYT
jgi:UDP-N-acetylglucosamine--dolichyl-phosphate N-acetylglucosaminephosphotransferase